MDALGHSISTASLRARSEAIHLGHSKKDGLPRRPKSLLAMTNLSSIELCGRER